MNDIASQSTVVSVLRQSLQSDNVSYMRSGNEIVLIDLCTVVASFVVLWTTGNGQDFNHFSFSARIIRVKKGNEGKNESTNALSLSLSSVRRSFVKEFWN